MEFNPFLDLCTLESRMRVWDYIFTKRFLSFSSIINTRVFLLNYWKKDTDLSSSKIGLLNYLGISSLIPFLKNIHSHLISLLTFSYAPKNGSWNRFTLKEVEVKYGSVFSEWSLSLSSLSWLILESIVLYFFNTLLSQLQKTFIVISH